MVWDHTVHHSRKDMIMRIYTIFCKFQFYSFTDFQSMQAQVEVFSLFIYLLYIPIAISPCSRSHPHKALPQSPLPLSSERVEDPLGTPTLTPQVSVGLGGSYSTEVRQGSTHTHAHTHTCTHIFFKCR